MVMVLEYKAEDGEKRAAVSTDRLDTGAYLVSIFNLLEWLSKTDLSNNDNNKNTMLLARVVELYTKMNTTLTEKGS